ncbi:MAG: glycosyl transferase family 2 [Rhodoferax sp.]|nr:glycosyl transferase family 2 [Rhodoferax sp.]
MNLRTDSLHVYSREIHAQEHTSLSALADLVKPGSQVLDLGCGSGALGRHLLEQRGCVVDGVTLNNAEAALAQPFYRRVEVANLDSCDVSELFAGAAYDYIVCADVLEHLTAPERTLAACRPLLTPMGEVLISIPNAGYAGLIAELLQGEFTYREEGLLDRTHLRFFTRQSLGRFLETEGWGIQALDTIQRALPESEFNTRFDQLPPTVARYLLGLPDALTYQFIVRARPQMAHAPLPAPLDAKAHALFTAYLYLGSESGYAEDRKLRATGIVGDEKQVLRFQLPAGTAFSSLRFDPADRPGFLHLHTITLTAADGQALWRWSMATDGFAALHGCASHDLLLHGPRLDASSGLALLYGDDPWIELPVASVLTQAEGGVLEVELGWPMSADFLALSDDVRELMAQHRAQQLKEREQYQTELQQARTEHEAALQELRVGSTAQLEQLELRMTALSAGAAKTAAAEAHVQLLLKSQETLLRQSRGLLDQKTVMVRDRLALDADMRTVTHERDILRQHLQALERSRLFRLTRRVVKAKIWLFARLRKAPPVAESASVAKPAQPQSAASATAASATRPVDVIVPVYRGLGDTQRCIRSVLAHAQKTPWRLIVINDCSPEPEVSAWLRETAAADPRITLLENALNLGFVATVNRGMQLNDGHDVVLLNSDAEVANDWLDRLVGAAYTNGRVATVTPFSNNATICSYPRFCEANELPDGQDTASLDKLFSAANRGEVVDVPTGIGFCMFIRRDCLADVGLFDVENFGKGYGEENDFCLRASAAGWRNLHALDTFVRHAGGVSFGASKNERERAAMETLRRLHPGYEPAVHAFVAADPVRHFRHQVDLARLRASEKPRVLTVLHNLGGGTARHVKELAEHLAPRAINLSLVPLPNGDVQVKWLDAREGFEALFPWPAEQENLVNLLRRIGVAHVHFHHLIGHDNAVMALPGLLGVAYDFSAHDYYTVCPQVSLTGPTNSYCGEQGVEQCRSCLHVKPTSHNTDIDTWRQRNGRFVADARHVLVPSRDAARRFARYIPLADIRLAPHTDMPALASVPVPAPLPLPERVPLRILVVGALSHIKGADALEAAAVAAAQTKAPLEFHLAGYAYRVLRTQPHASLTVHGPYAEQDLQPLLDMLKPDIVWFPAQWPETYSYTLSACLKAGLPVVAPNLGAFEERLAGRAWTWIRPWDMAAADWVTFFEDIRVRHFMTCQSPEAPNPLVASSADVIVREWSYDDEYLLGLTPSAPAEQPVPVAIALGH